MLITILVALPETVNNIPIRQTLSLQSLTPHILTFYKIIKIAQRLVRACSWVKDIIGHHERMQGTAGIADRRDVTIFNILILRSYKTKSRENVHTTLYEQELFCVCHQASLYRNMDLAGSLGAL